MTCYEISQGGEPMALVAEVAVAEAIVRCQPPGYYRVEAIEVGEPISRRMLRARRPSLGHRIKSIRRMAGKRRARWNPVPSTAPIERSMVPVEPARPQAR